MIEIQVWDGARETMWRELLPAWYSFWAGEPMNSGVWAKFKGDATQGRTNFVLDCVVNGKLPIVVAYDTEKSKVAGFLWSCMVYREDGTQDQPKKQNMDTFNFGKYGFPEESLVKLGALQQFIEQLVSSADIFNKFGVDEAWCMHTLSVCPNYTRRGLATKLVARGIQIAKERGATLVTAEATNCHSLHLFKKYFEFETVFEMSFAEHYGNYCDMPESMKETHSKAVVLVKWI